MQGDWIGQAMCARPEYRNLEWVADRSDHSTKAERERRKNLLTAVCNSCPVLVECREHAEKTHATIGFWAGKNYNHRFAVER